MKIFYHQHVLEIQETVAEPHNTAHQSLAWHLPPSQEPVPWPEASGLTPNEFLARFLELKRGSVRVQLAPGNTALQFVEALRDSLESVPAAGGLATTPALDLLMIHRNGYWDLPKGKIDRGETSAEAALREVEEETGATQLTLGDFLETSYHLYQDKRQKWCLKPTDWYRMHCPRPVPLRGQAEEGITDLKWVPRTEWAAYASQCYASIQDVMQGFIMRNPS